MNIQDFREKFKDYSARFLKDDLLFLSALLALVAFSSFGLGRLSIAVPENGVQPAGVVMTEGAKPAAAAAFKIENRAPGNEPQSGEGYVGSKNSDKYHRPWCSGAARIKEENKIYFATKAEAEAAGYTPAENCEGI